MSAAQEEFNELMRDKDHRTGHPEDDDDDGRSFLNLSDDDDDAGTSIASRANYDEALVRPSMSSTRSTIPRTRYDANTGPKGVIADAQNFRDSQRNHRSSVRVLTSSTNGLALGGQPPEQGIVQEDGDNELDDMLEEDDDFMAQWRLSRLRSLQSGSQGSNMNGTSANGRAYGSLTTVDGEGYLDALDKSPPETVVVVYIYDDYSRVSAAIEECIRELAGRFQDTRFVKLHFEDAQMEPAGVPALLAYRGGDKFAGLIPLIDEIPEDADLSATTLEDLLKRHQILR